MRRWLVLQVVVLQIQEEVAQVVLVLQHILQDHPLLMQAAVEVVKMQILLIVLPQDVVEQVEEEMEVVPILVQQDPEQQVERTLVVVAVVEAELIMPEVQAWLY